jgi:hypothetical protein
MKEINLTKDKVALISNKDFKRVSTHKWRSHSAHNGKLYAATGQGKDLILMHRFILEIKDETQVDHRDGNGLNNTRSNLRKATPSQNLANRGLQSNNRSGFKGVSYCRTRHKWLANIKHNGRSINLGRFNTKRAAAKAYDKAARSIFGEFAYLNFPDLQK